jgi:hypothetical protein
MDKVAEPFPAFASTTSVPPSCVLLVRALMSSWDNELLAGVAYMEEEDIQYRLTLQVCIIKGSPMNVAPACAGSREGSNHFGSYVHSLSLNFCKRLFPRLEPMASWSQGNSFTAVPGLPYKINLS